MNLESIKKFVEFLKIFSRSSGFAFLPDILKVLIRRSGWGLPV